MAVEETLIVDNGASRETSHMDGIASHIVPPHLRGNPPADWRLWGWLGVIIFISVLSALLL